MAKTVIHELGAGGHGHILIGLSVLVVTLRTTTVLAFRNGTNHGARITSEGGHTNHLMIFRWLLLDKR